MSGTAQYRIRNVVIIVLPMTLWFPGHLTEESLLPENVVHLLAKILSKFY
jgi:hypothetical protein